MPECSGRMGIPRSAHVCQFSSRIEPLPQRVCGELRFIDWSNDIVADSKPLQLHRLAHLVEIILTEQWDVFRLDHQISCEAEGGYMPVVCPVGVCDT